MASLQLETKADAQLAPERTANAVMTGKLLGITEGVASMNARIFLALGFCLMIGAATFVVDIIAFDYALTTGSKNGALVDKDSGVQLTTTPLAPLTIAMPAFSADAFLNTQVVRAKVSNGFGRFELKANEIRPCPVGMSDNHCCVGGSDFGPMQFKEADPIFVAGAIEADSLVAEHEHEHRHLLHRAGQYGSTKTHCHYADMDDGTPRECFCDGLFEGFSDHGGYACMATEPCCSPQCCDAAFVTAHEAAWLDSQKPAGMPGHK